MVATAGRANMGLRPQLGTLVHRLCATWRWWSLHQINPALPSNNLCVLARAPRGIQPPSALLPAVFVVGFALVAPPFPLPLSA